ncbi:unnamed protein product [Enterobius vermicularis]|uniref:Innexin n=1 Tax=Enterobius vermicularis TaxID=51028 RepID=A0A0N4UYA0_ENTVE|nr:unnamed protein product [Enterobius vermicularis]
MSSQIGAIVSANALIGRFLKQPKNELVDRLCSRITVSLLGLCSAILLSTHFWGEPITCWTPAQYVKHWYCRFRFFRVVVSSLDFVPKERRRYPIVYYQWVPYALAIQAVSYYIPQFVWKCLCSCSGFDYPKYYFSDFMSSSELRLDYNNHKSRLTVFEKQGAVFVWDGIICARRKRSQYIMLFYFICTVLQAVNAWLEFYFLNALLCSATYALWGPGIIADLARGIDWQTTGHFPRITHCDYVRRAPSTVQEDTVLCVLHLNIYYEKLFLFLWFWLLGVAILATAHSCIWSASLCTTNSVKNIRNYLNETTNASLDRFLNALGKDGVFILHNIALNIGDLPASNFIMNYLHMAGELFYSRKSFITVVAVSLS